MATRMNRLPETKRVGHVAVDLAILDRVLFADQARVVRVAGVEHSRGTIILEIESPHLPPISVDTPASQVPEYQTIITDHRRTVAFEPVHPVFMAQQRLDAVLADALGKLAEISDRTAADPVLHDPAARVVVPPHE